MIARNGTLPAKRARSGDKDDAPHSSFSEAQAGSYVPFYIRSIKQLNDGSWEKILTAAQAMISPRNQPPDNIKQSNPEEEEEAMYSDADDLPEQESGASDGENNVVCTHCNVSAHLHITHITLRLSLMMLKH